MRLLQPNASNVTVMAMSKKRFAFTGCSQCAACFERPLRFLLQWHHFIDQPIYLSTYFNAGLSLCISTFAMALKCEKISHAVEVFSKA